MLKFKKNLILFLVMVVVALGGIVGGYFFFGRDKVATAQEAPSKISSSLSQQALTTDIVLSNLKKEAVLNGHKGDFEYTYTQQDTFDYLLKKGKEGFWEGLWKDTLRFFFNREYTVDLYAEYHFGYDLHKINPEDIVIDEKKGSMIIYAPQLELTFVPKFPKSAEKTLEEENKKAKQAMDKMGDDSKKEEKEAKSTKTDSEFGIFRMPHTENDRNIITGAAIEVGEEKLLQDKKVIQQAYNDVNEELRDFLLNVPGAKTVEIRNKK